VLQQIEGNKILFLQHYLLDLNVRLENQGIIHFSQNCKTIQLHPFEFASKTITFSGAKSFLT
jgi:hypothetical protein